MTQIKRKSSLCFLTSLACFTWVSSVCFSLPSVPVAQSGKVEVSCPNSHTMVIKASDGAILHYEDFQVGPGEEVRFEQSAASHHILGKNASQILGSIQSAGKVALVNNNGFFFGPSSQTKVQKLQVEGSQICVQGSIDGTSTTSTGGEVHLFGQEILLQGAKIDVSGLLGGGEVLIGGEFQGKGTTPYASKVIMDEVSEIRANATENGDGGLVVLWSQDQTRFDGKISAQGGVLGGRGGLVETSSQGMLDVSKGEVNTLDANEEAGEWLLDPKYMDILDNVDENYGYGNCDNTYPNGTLNTDKFHNLKSHITVMANTGITIWDSISVTGSGGFIPNLTFKTCAYGFVSFTDLENCSKNLSITTDGGSILFDNALSCYIQCSKVTITTHGGNVTLNSLAQTSTCYNASKPPELVIDAGGGKVVVSTALQQFVSEFPYLQGSITISNASLVKTLGLFINGALTMPSIPLLFLKDGFGTINTNNHNISTGSIGAASDYTGSISLVAGASNTITIGAIGDTSISGMMPPKSFSIPSNSASNVSLGNVTTASGDISILSPSTFIAGSFLSANGGTVFLGSTTTSGTVSIGSNVSFTNNASVSGTFVVEKDISFDSTSSVKGTFTANGDILFVNSPAISGTFTAEGSITASDSLSLKGNTVLNPTIGLTIGSQISSNGSGSYDLTVTAPNAPISIGGDVVSLHSFIITSAREISLFDIITTGGDISIPCPAMLKAGSVISSGGGNIIFSSTLNPSVADCDLTINTNADLVAGSITLQGLGTAGVFFDNISLYGGVITLGQGVNITGTFGISNSQPMTIAGGDVAVGRDFNQLGTAALSLGSSITAGGSISFQGPLTISNSLALTGAGGISLSGPISTSVAAPSLTLDAGSHALTLPFLGSSTAPFGAVTIKSSNLSLGGDIYSISSLYIGSSITIAQPTALTAPSGISIIGAVTSSSGNPTLTLLADSGPVEIKNLGSSDSLLGAISLTGQYVTLGGNISSMASIEIEGPITINSSVTVRGDSGIILHQDLNRSTDPFNLTLQASGGSVIVQNLGSASACLGNISILSAGSLTPGNLFSTGNIDLSGTTITLSSTAKVSAAGNISINNTGPLTIPAGTLYVAGNFSQLGSGAVSLGTSIATAGSITFTGEITIAGNTVLQGTQGITIPGVVLSNAPNWNLTLDAGTKPLSISSLGSASVPFGDLSITTSELTLGGDVYASSSIFLASPITLTANSKLYSKGYGGISIMGAITSKSGTPSLEIIDESGPLELIKNLGSDTAPLGSITLKGSYVTLSGNMTSVAAIVIECPITVTGSLTFRGDQGITFNDVLTPSTDAFDHTLVASNGMVSVRDLGSVTNLLGKVSLTGMQGVKVQGTIYTDPTQGSLTITDQTGTTVYPPGTYP